MYVRDPGAKRKVRAHGELVALARRGEEAARLARERLYSTPAVADVLRSPEVGYAATEGREARVTWHRELQRAIGIAKFEGG